NSRDRRSRCDWQDDDEWGKVPVACIVKMNPSITEESILSVLKDILASYKIPKEIIFMDRLPRNSSQKLMRGELLNHINKMIKYLDIINYGNNLIQIHHYYIIICFI